MPSIEFSSRLGEDFGLGSVLYSAGCKRVKVDTVPYSRIHRGDHIKQGERKQSLLFEKYEQGYTSPSSQNTKKKINYKSRKHTHTHSLSLLEHTSQRPRTPKIILALQTAPP